MFTLTERLDDRFTYKGMVLLVDMAFDNVLRIFELLEDPLFHDYEKVEIALEMLVINYPLIADEHFEVKCKLFLFIAKEFLGVDFIERETTDQEQPNSPQETNEEQEEEARIYDFTQDAGIIYASFFRAYNMDLLEMQGKLHYKKFIQLLMHLDDKSKFKEVLHIRSMKLPKPDKYNAEYRADIMKMKRTYALPDNRPEEQQVKKLDKKLDQLATFFKS